MADERPFAEWIALVRAGDAQAAEQLVQRYERGIRIRVRAMLTDPSLRRQFDSLDVCQSVLGSFFVRAAAGQFDLDNPAQLVGLLVRMAQNKFGMTVRHHQQQCRDRRREVAAGDNAPLLADVNPGPASRVEYRDLLHTLLDRLTPEERELAQRRAIGQTWEEIAADNGGTAEGHRIRLSRAIDRVVPSLGLVDDSDPQEDNP